MALMLILNSSLKTQSDGLLPIPEWLQGRQIPHLRQQPQKQVKKWPRIEVAAGSLRVGKTTAAEVLAEDFERRGFPVTLSLEDWQHNPYLKDQYLSNDPSEHLLNSQLYFAKRKQEQLASDDGSRIFIQDVPPEMDFNYALTNAFLERMKAHHFETYADEYGSLSWDTVELPDLLLFLTVSDDVLLDRARQNAREFEQIEEEYFKAMNALNMSWIHEVQEVLPVLLYDTDEHDFAHDDGEQALLVETVIDTLQKLGWEF